MSFTPDFVTWLKSSASKVLLAEVGVKVSGVETTRYLSTLGYESENQYIPRLTGGFSFTRSLDLSGEGGQVAWGELDLDNSDGFLDSWLYDIWSGRSITLKLGDISWPLANFVTVFVGTLDDIAVRAKDVLTLKLRDLLNSLNAPIATETLSGVGDNKDALLPIALGEVFNCEPLLVSTSGNPVYQFSRGVAERIIEVRDNGMPVTVTEDLTNSRFTLTTQKYGQITCDVQGVKVSGVYRNDVGSLIEWVATNVGDGQKLLLSDFDTTAMTSFKSSHTQPVGIYLNNRENRLEVMQRLAATVGATVTATPLGKISLIKLTYGTLAGVIDETCMVNGTFTPVERLPVKGSVQLAGCRNWSPQAVSEQAASLTSTTNPILADEWITVTSRNSTVITDYKQTDTPTSVETLFIVEADMQAEADRRLALFDEPRTLFRFEAFAEALDFEVGETRTLYHSRFGLSSGKSALITSMAIDYVKCRVTVEVLV